jgi:hypothetical protein
VLVTHTRVSYNQDRHTVVPSTTSGCHTINLVTISHNKQHCFFGFIITKVISKYLHFIELQSVSPHILILISQREEKNFLIFLEHSTLFCVFFPLSCCTVRVRTKNVYCTVWKLLCKTLYHAARIYTLC